jgi:hypothetical protein
MSQQPSYAPSKWFERAAAWYVESHQGCVCCGGQHCVFHTEWCQRIEYYCSVCDFSACHDLRTGHYYASPGDGRGLLGAVLGPEYCDAGNESSPPAR